MSNQIKSFKCINSMFKDFLKHYFVIKLYLFVDLDFQKRVLIGHRNFMGSIFVETML